MKRIEKKMAPKVEKAIRSIKAEAVKRTGQGLDPIPLDYRTRWSEKLYRSQIRDGALAAVTGWVSAAKITDQKDDDDFLGIGAPDDFLTSPVKTEVDDYFELVSNEQADTQAEKINAIFEKSKYEELVNPDTGQVTYRGLDPKEIARALRRESLATTVYEAERIARTGVVWAHNQGSIQQYRSMGVTEKQWYTTEDERVCDFCGSLHKRVIEINEAYIPAGG